MTNPTPPGRVPDALTSLAHEIFALAQRAPSEGIEDAVARISATLHAQQPAPAGATLDELLILLGSKKAWPSYYFNHKDRYECCDCGKEHDDYAEITHAETCDFTQATADRKRIKELVEILKARAPTAQAAPAAVAGCTRSHPHEIMDAACRAKAAIAEMQNMAARGAEATAQDLDRLVGMLAAAPTPAAQADSQPAPDERDDFEKVFPLPSGCIRVGTDYASTGYSNWAAHAHCERWQGWQARAARDPAGSAIKDHQIAALVNELRDIAVQYHGTQQLRERIAHVVVPVLRAADSVLEDAVQESEYRRGYRHGYEQRDAEVRGALA